MGDGGILNRATNARKTSDLAGAQEKIELLVAEASYDYLQEKYVNGNGSTTQDKDDFILGQLSEKVGSFEGCTLALTSNVVTLSKDGKSVTGTLSDGSINWASTETASSGDSPNGGGSNETLISKDGNTSYVGCYADIDGDDEVDGIIYVDLIAQSGETGTYGEDTDYAWAGGYTIPTVTASNLNDYVISQEGVVDSRFDSTPRDVVKLATGSTREDSKSRFYVMGLEDITDGTNDRLYWYYEAWDSTNYEGRMTDYTDANGGSPTSVYFGTGKTNTATMMTKWNSEDYGEQNSRDLWGNISSQVSNGWFVPSREELSAFGKAFSIDESNHENYKLSGLFWSSSQSCALDAWCANFSEGWMGEGAGVNCYVRVRLISTF